jgi:hypothetical protein
LSPARVSALNRFPKLGPAGYLLAGTNMPKLGSKVKKEFRFLPKSCHILTN